MSRTPRKLLQTPAQPLAASAPASFDASRPAPQTDALRNAYLAGHEQGYRKAYMAGWRHGVLNGACATVCLAILIVGVGIGLGLL